MAGSSWGGVGLRLGAVGIAVVALVGPAAGRAVAQGSGGLSVRLAWVHDLADQDVGGVTGTIAESSPTVADLAGGPAVVVGDLGGNLWAFNLATGNPVPGWPAHTAPAAAPGPQRPLDGPVSAVRLAGQPYDTVFVGVGDAAHNRVPLAFEAFNADGTLLWAQSNAGLPTQDLLSGDQAGLTIFGPPRHRQVVSGTLGVVLHALNASSGSLRWSFLTADSDYATPAVGDLVGDGQEQLVMGGDSTLDPLHPHEYAKGGHLRILGASGRQRCQLEPQPDQVVDSSPAIGPIFGGATGVVVGTGTEYPTGTDTDRLLAMRPDCQLAWTARLGGSTTASPALADVEGTSGQIQIVEVASTGTTSDGLVYVLSGQGKVLAPWPVHTQAPVVAGSAVTADLSGAGYQDVIVPTADGAEIFDGRSGQLLATPGANQVVMESTPLVTPAEKGKVGLTLAGFHAATSGCPGNAASCAQGIVEHFVISGTGVRVGPPSKSWPMFHHDPALSGAVAG